MVLKFSPVIFASRTSQRSRSQFPTTRISCRRRNRRYIRHVAQRSYLSISNGVDAKPAGPDGGPSNENKDSDSTPILLKMLETSATTFASLFILGLAGYGYHKYYKDLVLRKMELAFKPGDPVLVLAELDGQKPDSILGADSRHWIHRAEQDEIDAIVHGADKGHYHLLIGEKGTGKSSMILEAMSKINGEGVAMFDAHADLEIFRVRLGKALNYEFHEDYIGSLFSIKGPRDTTALLDIERAFNKLEKVALRRRKSVGRPLVIIINSMHLLRDDEDGRDLLELIQQRAEQWAASNLVTIVLNSDDYWVSSRLKQLATRLRIHAISDLPRSSALSALASYRQKYFSTQPSPSPSILNKVYSLVGGRLTYLSRVAKAQDMIAECKAICQREKTWFLNQCWILGEEMDDDVMDQQKFASCAMLLAKALVDKEKEERGVDAETVGTREASSKGPASNDAWVESRGEVEKRLTQLPLHVARQIMTRADFIQAYDHVNIFTIDSEAMVRADSVPMQNAFREICSEPGFEEHLQKTLDRIAAIESLGRTREVVAKDLVSEGKVYKVEGGKKGWTVKVEESKVDDKG